MAWYFAIPQVMRIFVSVRGVTINWLLCADVFILLNLVLAVGSHRKLKSTASLQALCIYVNWAILLTPMVIISFLKCPWTNTDSLVASLIGVSAGVVIGFGQCMQRGIGDHVVRGLLVGLFRVVPHLYMSYCIIHAGSGDGVAAKTVFAANVTATARIITLFLAGRKSGWEHGVRASFLSELANEVSWLLTTATWLIYR